MPSYAGHDTRNDALYSDIPDRGPVWDKTAYGDISSYGVNDDGTGKPGSKQAAVDRFQQMGQGYANTAAPTIDYSQAAQHRDQFANARGLAYGNQQNAQYARGSQGDALGLMQGAAYGNAPSRAEILGHQMADQSLQAQMAGAASARGGALAQASAMRNAQQGAAAFQQQNTTNMAAMRADEMARARDAYMGGASTMRAQDYTGAAQATDMMGREADMMSREGQMAQAQTDTEMRQRMLNAQQQQYYEGLGNDVNKFSVNTELAKQGLLEGQRQFDVGMRDKQDSRADAFAGQLMNSMGSFLGGMGQPSDARAKREMQPMGELEPWLPPYTFPSTSLISDPQAKTAMQPMGAIPNYDYTPDADGFVRQNPFGSPDIVRDNPYGAPPAPAQAGSGGGKSMALSGIGAGMKGLGGGMSAMAVTPAMAPTVDYRAYVPPVTSSEETKREMQPMGHDVFVPVYGTPDTDRLRMSDAGRAYFAEEPKRSRFEPSIAGDAPRFSSGEPASAPSRSKAGGGERKKSAEELAREADAMGANLRAQHADSLAQAPAVGRKRVSDAEAARMQAEANAMMAGYRDTLAEGPAVHGQDPRAAPPAQMLDAIGGGVTYRYRPGVPGVDPSEQQYGTTTQDLRQTPMGSSMVVQDPASGYEGIDARRAVGPTLASLGNLNQRLRRLEEMR